MRAPSTRAVMAALSAGGGEARFVGGCVRDTILGSAVRDIDIATHEPPDRVIRLLEDAGIKAIPTGIAHGTVTAVVGEEHFEITTLRVDVKTHGRRAEVAFTDDWGEDAARRDFTINALSLTETGELYDPFGGLEDLAAGRVRFVGDAETRIREDVLRLLRFFRFFAYYGRPPPDRQALAAVKKLAPLVPTLSGERVWAELIRLLQAPDPAAIFRLMADQGVAEHVFPEGISLDRLAALSEVEAAHGIAGEASDPLRRLAALAGSGPGRAEGLAERLRLSRKDRERLVKMTGSGDMVASGQSPRQAHAAIYRLGNALYRDVVFLAWAAERAEGSGGPAADAGFGAALETAAIWPRPELPIRGEDALNMGLAPGPAVGRAVAAVEAWWVAEDFAPDREACLERLRETVEDGGPGAETP